MQQQQQRLPMGIAQPGPQRPQGPQVPPNVARSPQFGAAKEIAMDGLPQLFKQLFDDQVTFQAMELLEGAQREEAMNNAPSGDSIKAQNEQGLNALFASLGPGIRQRGNQLAQQQQQQQQQSANNMPMAAQGGIVGYAQGGLKKPGKKEKGITKFPGGETLQQERERYQTLKRLEAKFRAEGNQEALQNVQRELENYEGSIAAQPTPPRPQNIPQMAGGGIVSFKEGGQPPMYEQQFTTDFSRGANDRQAAFEDISSWVRNYQIEPEIADIVLNNPNSVAGDQVNVLKQVLIGAGGRTLDEINEIVSSFASLQNRGNVNPRGERDFSRAEEPVEGRGLMALGQDRAAQNAAAREANVGQQLRAERPQGLEGQRFSPGNRMPPEEVERRREEYRRSRQSAPDETGIASLGDARTSQPTTSEEIIARTKAHVGLGSGVTSGETLNETGVASLNRQETPSASPMSEEARRSVAEFYESVGIPQALRGEEREDALAEYYSDARSGDSSNVFVPMMPGDRPMVDSLIRRIKENPGTAASTLMMAIPVGGWAAGIGVKAATKLVPYVLKHPALASFLTGAAMRLPFDKIDVEGALRGMGLGEDYGEVAETLTTFAVGEDPNRNFVSPPQSTDAEVAAEVITSGPEEISAETITTTDSPPGRVNVGGRRTDAAGLQAPPNLVSALDRGNQTADQIQTGLAAFDSDARRGAQAGAGTSPNVTAGVQNLQNLANSAGSGGMQNYQDEIDRLIARDTNPIRTLAQYAMGVGKGNTPIEGMMLGSEMINGLEKKLDADKRALMGLIEAQRISERDAAQAQERLRIQEAQVKAMREGDYARLLGNLYSADQRTKLTAGDIARIRYDISENEGLTGDLRAIATRRLLERELGENANKGSFFGRSEAEKLLDDPTFQAQVDILVRQLENQETQRITGQ